MKLVVIIPAYNEEKTISDVITSIPKKINGISRVEVLVVNDGSSDRTAQIAKESGALVVSHKKNLGLATSFRDGFEKALKLGADIVVNTDADNQYDQFEIPKLIKPILDGEADIVVGDRQVLKLDHMPFGKKYGNTIASFVTRKLSGYDIRDAQSGFRAYSREASLRINILSNYTYVAETIIQAVNKKLKIVQVPISFKERKGKSRLVSNIFNYAAKAGMTIIRTYTLYKPLRVFLSFGGLIMLFGILLSLRFFIPFFSGISGQHIQSLVVASTLFVFGFLVVLLGLIADMLNANRLINEEILYRQKKRYFGFNGK